MSEEAGSQRPVGYVYGVRRADDDEYRYVGQTQAEVRRRFGRHLSQVRSGRKTPFYDWLRSVREAAVEVDVLDVIRSSPLELGEREIRWIALTRLDGMRLLNLSDGGLGPTGVTWTAEQREAARLRSTGRAGVSRFGADNPFLGRSHSAEQRQQWSEARKGQGLGAHNPNYGKFGPDHPGFGRIMTEEQRQALSEARRGSDNPNYGKTASEETRAKRSASLRGRPMPSSRRSAHTRYHTNRGVVSDDCLYCSETISADQQTDKKDET